MHAPPDRTAVPVTPARRFSRDAVLGAAAGLLAAVIWATYQAYTRAAAVEGFEPWDIAVIRFAFAGLLLAPVLMRRGVRDLGGVGWPRGLFLAVIAGPAFVMLVAEAYHYVPLALGSVLQPTTASLGGILLAAVVLRERVMPMRLVGIVVVVCGLALLLSAAPSATGWQALIGEGLFVAGGSIWAVFTVCMRRWRLDPLTVTAVVCVLSGVVTVPVYLALFGIERLMAFSLSAIAIQAVVQGLLSAAVAVWAFSVSVEKLGAGSASLFLAAIPCLANLIGIPVTGELPSGWEAVGMVVVTIGLVVALRGMPPPTPVAVPAADAGAATPR